MAPSRTKSAGRARGGRNAVTWEKLRTSFWVVPGGMAMLAGVLAYLAHLGDLWLTTPNVSDLPPPIFVSTPGTARDVISTLLSSMITMTSLVFSITMVVLTLAASQFGPRLIRSFMSDPRTQVVLGVFVMTSVYCLIILGSIGTASSGEAQEAFVTVSVALLLTLLSLGVLVLFLHFLARSIVSETVIERVGEEIDELIADLDPIAEERKGLDAYLPEDYPSVSRFFGPSVDGYVEAIDFPLLVEEAERAGVLIGLSFRPGDYVVVDGRGIGVYPGDRCSEQLEQAVLDAIVIGSHRTPNQDPEFSIRHLVEIAVRALSPGINDPYTAVAVVNQLSAALSRLMGRALPDGAMRDGGGTLRVVCGQSTYASLVGVAFNQIRQNAAGKPIILIHLLEAIERIAAHARLEAQREVLRAHVLAISDAAKRDVPDAMDLAAVVARVEAAAAALAPRPAGLQ